LEEDIFRLDEIVIQQQLSALNVISKMIWKLRFSQEMRKVPGLFMDNTVEESRANISKRI
jgi:hypothetical protein